MAERRVDRWLRPRNIFGLVALLVLIALLFSRPTGPQDRAGPRSTYGSALSGTRGAYDVIARLGWHTARRLRPWNATLDTSSVYVILSPILNPSATETGALLDAVRRGATAIVEAARKGPLADSLRMVRSNLKFDLRPDTTANRDSTPEETAIMTAAAAGRAIRFQTYLRPVPADTADAALGAGAADTVARFPADMRVLAHSRHGAQREPEIASRPFGAGQVIVVADANFLTNTLLREGDGAVLMVRLLERLDPLRRRPVVFDEYHQGFGEHASPVAEVRHALTRTAPGRTALQVGVAGLILLLALAVRPIAPVARRSIERRSPFEHVGALSRAYEQVGATRLATQRLLRGLRRRHPMGAASTLDDAGYLTLLGARVPALRADAESLRGALERPLPPADWVRVGTAVAHIERTFPQ